jgi:hypothetical protein
MGKGARLKAQRRRAEEEARRHKEEHRAAARRGAAEGVERGCLFCRRSDGGFTSLEHIFPEGLGNTEHLLPVGVVCDRCNNGTLSRLDAALLDFGPVAMLRTIRGIRSKSGRLPRFSFDNGSLQATSPDHLSLQLDSARWHRRQSCAPPGWNSWSFTAKRMDATPKRLSLVHRALTKIALEYAFLDFGPDRVLSSDFDHERNVVLHGRHRGYLVIPKNGEPDAPIDFSYMAARRPEDGHPLMLIEACILGVTLATDTLRSAPPFSPPEAVSVLSFG